MSTSASSHVALVWMTSPMSFAECARRIKSHIAVQVVKKLPNGDSQSIAHMIDVSMMQPVIQDIHHNIQTLHDADVWSLHNAKYSHDDVLVFYVAQQSAAYAEQLYNVFMHPEQYPDMQEDALFYRNRYPHWQQFLAQQYAFFKKYSGQCYAIARAQTTYVQQQDDSQNYRICFDPYYAISFERPFVLQGLVPDRNESMIEVESASLQKRCLPVDIAKRLITHIFDSNGMYIQQGHSDLYEWLRNITYADITDGRAAPTLYPSTFIASNMRLVQPPPATTQVPSLQVQPPRHIEHPVSQRTPFAMVFRQHQDDPSQTNIVRTTCTLYQQDNKIGEADYIVSIQDPHTRIFHWIVIIEVNAMTPLVYDQIRTRVRQFRTANAFTDTTQKERTPIQMAHGILFVVDVFGIYVLRDGEFVAECALQKPLWRRTEFATRSLDEIVARICRYIVPPPPEPMSPPPVVHESVDELQPVPDLPQPQPMSTDDSTPSTSSGCVINGMFITGAGICWIIAGGFNLSFFVCVCILFVIYRYTRVT